MKKALLLLCLSTLLWAACGESTAVLSTSTGNVRVIGADSDVAFPPGCEESVCEISVGQSAILVIVWLEGEDGEPIVGDLMEDYEENARLIGEDNQPSSRFSAGVLDDRNYVIFPVPTPSARYTLEWGDNLPVNIVP